MVVAGSNPDVILEIVEELVEIAQLADGKVKYALSTLGYYVKFPTRQLLH